MALGANKGINPVQLRALVRRVLESADLWSPAAENLVLGTIAQESALGHYTRQIRGPAVGIVQMEPATFEWLQTVYEFQLGGRRAEEMEWDLWLAILACRLRYRVVKAPLPENNVPALAAYWKKYYNTPLGAGTEEEFINNFKKYLGEI